MPVFRYDTRDVVRRLPDERLDCSLAGVPATSRILGKAGQLLRDRRPSRSRRASSSRPARRCRASRGRPASRPARVRRHLELELSRGRAASLRRGELERLSVAEPATCRSSAAPRTARPRPGCGRVRADLLETTFTAQEG